MFLLSLVITLSGRPLWAQSICEEPVDDLYSAMSETVRAAIEAENYGAALVQLQFAAETYDTAVLDYATARALHHLMRFEEAIDAYNRFLTRFEGCPDPNELMETARGYRNLAVQELAATFQVPPEGGGEPSGVKPGWIVFGVGSGLVLAGVVFDLTKLNLDDDLRNAYDNNQVTRANALEDERDQGVVIEAVLYGTGLAAIVTGTLLLLLLDDEPVADGLGLGWDPTRGGAVYSIRGSF